MELEFLTHNVETNASYEFEMNEGADGLVIDWADDGPCDRARCARCGFCRCHRR